MFRELTCRALNYMSKGHIFFLIQQQKKQRAKINKVTICGVSSILSLPPFFSRAGPSDIIRNFARLQKHRPTKQLKRGKFCTRKKNDKLNRCLNNTLYLFTFFLHAFEQSKDRRWRADEGQGSYCSMFRVFCLYTNVILVNKWKSVSGQKIKLERTTATATENIYIF